MATVKHAISERDVVVLRERVGGWPVSTTAAVISVPTPGAGSGRRGSQGPPTRALPFFPPASLGTDAAGLPPKQRTPGIVTPGVLSRAKEASTNNVELGWLVEMWREPRIGGVYRAPTIVEAQRIVLALRAVARPTSRARRGSS